jgi:hypothetical protein
VNLRGIGTATAMSWLTTPADAHVRAERL